MVLDPRRNAVYCLVNYEGFALGLLGLSPGFATRIRWGNVGRAGGSAKDLQREGMGISSGKYIVCNSLIVLCQHPMVLVWQT